MIIPPYHYLYCEYLCLRKISEILYYLWITKILKPKLN